jgi:hypothetical protein
MLLISYLRLLFDDQGQWGKNAEEEVLATIKNVFTYFPHVVSQNQVLYCDADNRMVWVLNSM